eukprot:jgi/Botrbrau1/14326/Bobra.0287s0018.1
MGKRTLLRGDRHRAVADAEEGVAVPLLRTRQPQVQQQVQARGRWVPYLAFAVLLAWIGVMVFVLLGGMDTICPSCTRLSNNLLEAVHGNGGSSGLHMRMKYVKGISEPESKAWVLASALPLQSFAVAEGTGWTRSCQGPGVPTRPLSRMTSILGRDRPALVGHRRSLLTRTRDCTVPSGSP